MTSEMDAAEILKWHLLADATTDAYAVPEALDYSSLVQGIDDDVVVSTLRRLVDEGLIEFFFEHPEPDIPESEQTTTAFGIWSALRRGRTPNTKARSVVSSAEAQEILTDARWRAVGATDAHGRKLLYAATPRGNEAFSSLDPAVVRLIWPTSNDSH